MAKEFVEAILNNSGYGEFPYYTAVPSIDEPQGFMNHVVFNGLVRYHKVTQDERVAKAIVQAADRIVNDVSLNSGEFIPMGLEVLGVFHSHPDNPNRPSEFDRQWAWPNFSYLITSVVQGVAVESRSWRLDEDRSKFSEEEIKIIQEVNT